MDIYCCMMHIYCCTNYYSKNQKTVVYKFDIKTKLKCIWSCYKASSCTINLLNHLLSEMSLFTLHSAQLSHNY